MCNFTYTFLECGHRIEDNVKGCPRYQDTGAHCDPEDPAKRKFVIIRSVEQNGICAACLKKEQETEELASMHREQRKAREVEREQARKQEFAHRAREEKILRGSREEFLRMQREADEEAERIMRETRVQSEMERDSMNTAAMKAALDASLRDMPSSYSGGGPDGRDLYDEYHEEGREKVDGKEHGWEVHMTTKITATKTTTSTCPDRSAIPTPLPSPALSPSPPPSRPPSPPLASDFPPMFSAPAPSPSTETPSTPKPQFPIDYSASPVGEQQYGHYWVGTRRMPLASPTQKTDHSRTASTPVPAIKTPSAPVRLGGVIAPGPPSYFQTPKPDSPSRPPLFNRGSSRNSWRAARSPEPEPANELLNKLNRRRKKIEELEASGTAPK